MLTLSRPLQVRERIQRTLTNYVSVFKNSKIPVSFRHVSLSETPIYLTGVGPDEDTAFFIVFSSFSFIYLSFCLTPITIKLVRLFKISSYLKERIRDRES